MQAEKELPSVRIRCAFPRPVDADLDQEVERSLREFFQGDPGFVNVRHWTVGWTVAPHTTTTFRTIWASDAQADDAAVRASDWEHSNEERFGWQTCDITAERTP